MPDTTTTARDPFGIYGNLNRHIGTTKPDLTGLPDWLSSQLQDEVRVDESGNQTHNYSFNQNPWGGFKGQDGKYYVQIGDPSNWKPGDQDGGVKDPSKVTYDPNVGYITTADNLHDSGIGGPDWRMIAAVVGAGALGTALAGGAEGLGGVAATDAAESGGTLALNAAGTSTAPYVGTTAAEGSLGGALAGSAGDESAGLSMANPFTTGGGDESLGLLGTGVDGTGISPTMSAEGISVAGAEAPWYQEYLNKITNPQFLSKLPSLASALKPTTKPNTYGGAPGAGSLNAGGGGSVGGSLRSGGAASALDTNPYAKYKPQTVRPLGDYLRGVA